MRIQTTLLAVALCAAVPAVDAQSGSAGQQPQRQRRRRQPEPANLPPPVADGFQPLRVVPQFPPITDAASIPASDVTGQVGGSELVLGVVENGEARAYPINMLTGPVREIINDTLGGRAIAATWWHLCYNGVVYARKVKSKTLTFGVSGLLWDRSLVMYDKETNSHWSHVRGEAMQGELIGSKLTMLTSEMTTWDDWLAKHPETTVLNMERTAKRFTSEFYRNPSEFIYGWTIRRKRYHFQISALLKEPVRNLEIDGEPLLLFDKRSTSARILSRKVGERILTFKTVGEGILRDDETGSIWRVRGLAAIGGPLKEKRLEQRLGMLSYKRAWDTFYPESQDVTE